MKRMYGAYGSNLNLDQMAWRCPTAKLYAAGVIEGYRLTFQGEKGCSYANIVPDENSSVPVLVWELGPHDEQRLDRYEGYPRLYTKETVPARLDSGETVDLMVYIMTDLRPNFGVPSESYYQGVEAGYLKAGFPLAPIEEALADSLWAADFLRSAEQTRQNVGGRNG